MKVLTTLAGVSVASASDLGYWKLYCGDSCSAGALISQGDFYNNVSTACTSLGDTYAYCYLEVPEGFTAIYHSSLSAEATCGTPTILNSGDCTGAGSWISYEMIYSA